jgi:hypothetical protein
MTDAMRWFLLVRWGIGPEPVPVSGTGRVRVPMDGSRPGSVQQHCWSVRPPLTSLLRSGAVPAQVHPPLPAKPVIGTSSGDRYEFW